MESESQYSEANLTPLIQTNKKLQEKNSVSISIDLSNQKLGTGSEIEASNFVKDFSKTQTDALFAVSKQSSGTTFPEAPHQIVSKLLDSELSSPTMKSDVALRATAKFTHDQMPAHLNIQNPGQKNSRDPSNVRGQPQVLAASGPGNISHLKSQSTSNTQNYYSNMQVNQLIQAEQTLPQANMSQGRTTETRKKQKAEVAGLSNQGYTAKSAVLHTTSSKERREIKRIPSKTKVNHDKSKKRKQVIKNNQPLDNNIQNIQYMLAQQHAINMPNEVLMVNQDPSGSIGSKHQQRNSSTTNRMMNGQNIDTTVQNPIHQSIHTSQQHTPQVHHHNPQQMFTQGMPNTEVPQQFAGFSFVNPMMGQQNPFQFTAQGMPNQLIQQQQQQILATSQMNYQMQPQPQVHFIAKQQKFYGISPERAPLIFKHSSQDKRPYTSSGNVLNKRPSKVSQQSSAIAALYMGSKTHHNGFGLHHQNNAPQARNSSQPNDHLHQQKQHDMHQAMIGTVQHPTASAYQMQNLPHRSHGFQAAKSAMQKVPKGTPLTAHKSSQFAHGHSVYSQSHVASQEAILAKQPEQLQMEVIQYKQAANQAKDENVKLKTKIKILENENGRMERTIEDFLQQNQFIQNAQKNAANMGTLAPIVQTAQRYQAETFLVMSLKKQVKEMKTQICKKDEELTQTQKNIKNTKFYEMDQEIKMYKDELIRLRYLLEQSYLGQGGALTSENGDSGRPSVNAFSLPFTQSPFMVPAQSSQNQSQPAIISSIVSQPSASLKLASNSQTNFFQDATSNMSQNLPFAASQKVPSGCNQYTLSNEDQVSNFTNETIQNQLPPLKTAAIVMQNQGQQLQQTLSVQKQPSATAINAKTDQQIQQYQMSIQEQSSALSGALSNVDTRDQEFVQMLTYQLGDKDSKIRKLQQQVEEFSKNRLYRLQNTNSNEGKGGSAGPVSKTELARVRKQLREKEKEVQKLKNEGVDSNLKRASEEEQEKRVKKLQGQVSTYLQKTQEMKSEIKKRDERNEQMVKELSQANDLSKQSGDKQKREQITIQKKLQSQVEEMEHKIEEQSKENEKLTTQLQNKKEVKQTATPVKEEVSAEVEKQTQPKAEMEESKILSQIDQKSEGELGLVSTILGCRENRDRIEFASDLKEFVLKQDLSEEEKKATELTHLGLASDYKLTISEPLIKYVKQAKVVDLAYLMPKYEFISPSLALIIMQEIRKMLIEPELLEILNEKEIETKLPFDALRDLCSRFERTFTDEHCAFVTASYLTEINEGIIYINFKEFMIDLKDPRGKDIDYTNSKHRPTSSINSDGSDEIKRIMRAGAATSSPLSEIMARSGGKRSNRGGKKSAFEEEHMLDIAEAIFMKMADLMHEKSRSVRGIFTKYSVPEVFPDRTVLELLSPGGFIEGIKETGIEELQEFEVACLMRVLSKPELDNAVILNEFAMIMENFGVMDQMDEEENDDYISDTEQSIMESVDQSVVKASEDVKIPEEISKPDEEEEKVVVKAETEDKMPAVEEEKTKTPEEEKGKEKRKARSHNMANIDVKGIKILRKLARFLLKQFLHPREFFGKSVAKEQVKTKKREFYLDVMKFKQFYLLIKIANIRKRLTENESLNAELCLDKKTHKEYINVKLLVKALEELAEEEQKTLIDEEKEAADKRAKEQTNEESKNTLFGSDVETPRSDGDGKPQKAEEFPGGEKEEEKGGSPTSKDDDKKDAAKESYGLDASMKFGNAQVRTKNGTHSPMLGDRQFAHLNTIEEEKNETQTSHYFENASEREDSKLLSSNQFRGSNLGGGLEFESEEHKSSMQKLSPNDLDQTLSQHDKRSNTSQVMQSPCNEIDKVDTNIELPDRKHNNEGRLTGRVNSVKEHQLSKSLVETSIKQIQEKEKGGSEVSHFTPVTMQDKAKNAGLSTPRDAQSYTEINEDSDTNKLE